MAARPASRLRASALAIARATSSAKPERRLSPSGSASSTGPWIAAIAPHTVPATCTGAAIPFVNPSATRRRAGGSSGRSA